MNHDEENPIIINNEYDTLVLSGASSKFFILLGALQYAYDNYLTKNIKTYVGTSSGAFISYLLCIGYTPIELLVYVCTKQILEKMANFDIVRMMQGNGAASFNVIHEYLEKITIDKIGYLPTLKDLYEKFGKKLICVTHNLTQDSTEYISYENYPEIPCLTALRMSSNLPLVFTHYKYGHSFYIDGGISDNFAVQIAEKEGDKVLGFYLTAEGNDINQEVTEYSFVDYLYKLLLIPINQSVDYKLKLINSKTDIIKLKSNKIKFFDFNVASKDKLDMFSSGYRQSLEFFKI